MRLFDLHLPSCLWVSHHSDKLGVWRLSEVNVFNPIKCAVVPRHDDFALKLTSDFVLQLYFTCKWQVLFYVLH